MPLEQVILVDERDRPIGVADKLDAHRNGARHRAFSVFVFDPAGRLLLQQRAAGKYHSGGLWTNTCCGHPRPGEATAAAARRRLQEEMGFDCGLEPAGQFAYRAPIGELIEDEIDHVFAGRFGGSPRPAPDEVAAWRWIDVAELAADLASHRGHYTAWLAPALEQVRARGHPGTPKR